MSAKVTIPVGARFGRLTVLGEAPERRRRQVYWDCRCDCGALVAILGYALRAGHTRSCGCLYRDTIRVRSTTHGLSKIGPEYIAWTAMRRRCRNLNGQDYPLYGGRGITVCPEWDDFTTFYRDLGPRPSPQHSLDRIDNDGPYCKDNCRWTTDTTQARNRRSSRTLTWRGETRSVPDWAEVVGLPWKTIHHRLALGWTVEQALTRPLRRGVAEATIGR